MKNKEINSDIIINSYYMIDLFNQKKVKNPEKSISITNLKLQKLMYFVEAYYMVKNPDDDQLFSTDWSAWDYGPVCQKLYDYFKKYGSIEIIISEEETEKGNALPEKNKEYIKEVFDIFGDLSAFDLVTLTHMSGSPWYEIYEENKNDNKYNFKKINNSIISKKKTKKWFEKRFNFIFENKKREQE